MNMTLNYTGQLIVQDCCSCGMTFGVPADFDKRRVDDKQTFYCPAGHPQSYTGKTEEKKLRERAEQLERELANRDRQLANKDEDLRATRASLIATKGVLTKAKKRIANGVCPCCQRSFANVERHMSSQHPDYAGQVTS